MIQEEKLCNEIETVREFTYLGDRVSISVGGEAVVMPEPDFFFFFFILGNVASYYVVGGIL